MESVANRLPDSRECRVFFGIDSDDNTQCTVCLGNDFGRRHQAHAIDRRVNVNELGELGRIVFQGVEIEVSTRPA